MRTALAAIGLAAITSAAMLEPAQSPANAQDLIWVTVNVIHRDGRLVPDLTAADFEVSDNGEPRPIAAFRNDRIPIAVAVMVDVSSSMETNYGLVRRALSALTSHFEAGDRAILGAFGNLPSIAPRFSARPEALQRSVMEVLGGTMPLCDGDWIDKSRLVRRSEQSRTSFGAVTDFSMRLRMTGGSAIWDGAACGINAVASDGETPRRVVVLITDGVDNMSFSTVAAVVERANRYGVMVYAVAVQGGYGMAGAELKALAEATGGGYFYLTGEDRVDEAFTRIGDELRRQYVFGFAAVGPIGGAHAITVKTRSPDVTARFRRVWMEAPAVRPAGSTPVPAVAEPAVAALPSSVALPESRAAAAGMPDAPLTPGAGRAPIWDDLDRFVKPEWVSGVASRRSIAELRALHATLRRDAGRWIAAGAESARPRRRIAVASFVLDLLYSQNDPYLWQERQPSAELIDWACAMLQSGPPSAEERLWYFGAIALVERGGAADPFDRLAVRAMQRFPDEPRFVLARAVAQDLRTWPEERDVHDFVAPPAVTSALIARYEAAAAIPVVAFEANLRLAYFDLRRGRTEAAVARFAALGDNPPADVSLRFWWRLLRGRALEQANRLPEAITLFQDALDDVPGASSARSALIAALAKARRPADAARVAARALATPAAPVDPWTLYVLPDFRFWPAITTQLRLAVTR